MNSYIQKQSPGKFLLTVIGLTALAMFITATVGYLATTSPRGFMVWVGVGFLCTIEFLAGILSVNIFARARCDYRPSGAILAITYGIIGAFAASGLLSIVAYWVVRDSEGTKDGVFTAVLMAITVFWFIVAFLLYAYDLHSQATARPAMEKRAEHRNHARALAPILSTIRALRINDNDIRNRMAVVLKKLEAIDVALSHSHGGGVGSWEAGQQHPLQPDQGQTIQDGIELMEGILAKFTAGTPVDIAVVVTELEQCVARMLSSVDTLELR